MLHAIFSFYSSDTLAPLSTTRQLFTRTQEFLMSTRLFSSLSKPQVDFLATCLQECTYSVGEKLWAASDAIETLYILREGNMHTQGSLTHTVPLRFAMPLSDTAAAVFTPCATMKQAR